MDTWCLPGFQGGSAIPQQAGKLPGPSDCRSASRLPWKSEALLDFSGGTKGFKPASLTAKPATIRELVDAYLALRKSQADSGDMSVAIYSDD